MSESLEITVSLKLNGEELKSLGFPLNRRVEVDEVQLMGPVDKADDGDDTTFSQVPIDSVASVEVLVYQAIDQALGLRVEGGESSTTAILLDAGGLVLIFDATGITVTNITDNNDSGSTAKRRGLAAGT